VKTNNINERFLTDLTIPENLYLLGRIWADGYISKYRIDIHGVWVDMEYLFPYLTSMGIFTIRHEQKKKNGLDYGKPQCVVGFSKTKFKNFVEITDLENKSTSNQDKLLELIPEHLHNHFWRGYFDGDGCIFLRKNGSGAKLTFWSTLDQDWKSLIDLFNKFNVTYNINEYIRKNGTHKSSMIEVGRSKDIKIIMDYFYENSNGIMLNRKYEKYLTLIESIKKMKRKNTNFKGIHYHKTLNKWGVFIPKKHQSYNKRKFLGWFKSEEEALQVKKLYCESNGIVDSYQSANILKHYISK